MWNSKFSGTQNVEERVRNSELFPRIRDAEVKAKANSKELKAQYDEYEAMKMEKMVFDPETERKKRTKKEKEDKKKNHNIKKKKDSSINTSHRGDEYFSTIVMNTDPEMKKYVDYSELHYPKLFGSSMNLPPGSIDTVWMSGFLDRAQRDGAELVKKKAAQILEKGVSAAVHPSGEKDKENDEKNDDYTAVDTMPSGVDDMSSKKPVKKVKKDIFKSVSDLAAEVQAHRGDIERKQAVDAARKDKMRAEFKIQNKINQRLKPYVSELNKHELYVREVQMPEVIDFVSTELEDYFEHLRQEHESASIIQKFWRRTKILIPWKKAINGMCAAAKIQKVARGMITRKWVARWFHTRTVTVTDVQAQIRKVLSNKHFKIVLKREQEAAIIIQRITRGKHGHKKAFNLRGRIAATRIQAIWRGVVARSKSDILWLNKVVVPIQKHGRTIIAVKNVAKLKVAYNQAATLIQKKWKTFVALKKFTKALEARDIRYVSDQSAILQAEEEFAQMKLERMIDRMLNHDLRIEAEAATNKLNDSYRACRRNENDYVEIARQREILSPRALTQGWIQDLDKQIYELRNETTNLKLKCLFQDLMHVQNIDAHLEVKLREIEDTAALRNRLFEWRDRELEKRMEKLSWLQIVVKRKEKRQAIADEKRKWRIVFYNSDGRPDRRRRPGRPWDSSAIAGPDKYVYNSANVNLFATNPDGKTHKVGSHEAIDRQLEQISLTTYLQQMHHYEQIMKPIQEIMQKTLGHPPKKPGPESKGFGLVGETLAPALWSIDAVPENWKRPLTPNGTHILNALETKKKAMREEKSKQREDRRQKYIAEIGEAPSEHELHKLELNDLRVKASSIIYNAESMEAESIVKEEVANVNAKHRTKRRDRLLNKHKGRKVTNAIPWNLLDKLEGEKAKFETEKIILDFERRNERRQFGLKEDA